MERERARLIEARTGVPWRKWGPYLSERQWGTVREDYSDSGDAWDYFTHDQARSRVYRRGEDGLAGISDDKQHLCFALALWNERDVILKERLFGLTNGEGNHGEDVKEYYYYLDSTPTHSYMRYLYKYPQRAYPYDSLVSVNRGRTRNEWEYELIDTGVFDEDRYFDVFVDYAKAEPEDMLVRVTIRNRGDASARLHVLPTLWFRNTWASNGHSHRPEIQRLDGGPEVRLVRASHPRVGAYTMYFEGEPELLFTENETNTERAFGLPNSLPYVKDGFHRYVIEGRKECVNPAGVGTKSAAHYVLDVPARGEVALRMRLRPQTPTSRPEEVLGPEFDAVFAERLREADSFYEEVTADNLSPDAASMVRQALAGMLWSKQYYFFDIHDYLVERGVDPLRSGKSLRNRDWFHMVNDDVISMPDKWEYPWYAAWDLAFHTVPLTMVDLDFAKAQLDLMISEVYLHPNGQIPAYEWNFGDVNPPVHAFAAMFLHRCEIAQRGRGDPEFLQRIFGKLAMNFTWWVNRKDRFGRNVFEGGFLGLDNISVFDRNAPLPNGGCIEQADGTAWMALFCQNMFEICVELASEATVFDYLATKFADHFFWIARAMNQMGPDGMWDEEDGFYYDVMRFPDGTSRRLKVRSLVGILPLCAATVIEPRKGIMMPRLRAHVAQRLHQLPELHRCMHPPETVGHAGRTLAALLTEERLRRVLGVLLDEREFLSPYGIRSVSRYHSDHPYELDVYGTRNVLSYLPAESDSGMFGGNSNWRGPVWMPINFMIIRSLLHYYEFYADNFRIEFPTGSGRELTLFEVARELSDRLASIFLRDPATGKRPVFGGVTKFQDDPHFRDHLLFYEYFHGDNGAGIGASHQTGWTGIVAKLTDMFARMDAHTFLERGLRAMFINEIPESERTPYPELPFQAPGP